MVKVKSGWFSARQAEEFARRKGGQVIRKAGPYQGAVILLPEAIKVYATEGRNEVETEGVVVNGQLFLGKEDYWAAYPNGRPTSLMLSIDVPSPVTGYVTLGELLGGGGHA